MTFWYLTYPSGRIFTNLQDEGLPFIATEEYAEFVKEFLVDIGFGVFTVRQWPPPVPVMPLYSQKDIRWAGEFVGNSDQIIGNAGSAITCLAMIMSFIHQEEFTPQAVNTALKYVDGFEPETARIRWGQVQDALLGLRLVAVEDYPYPQSGDPQTMNEALSIGEFVILQVDSAPTTATPDYHHVVVVEQVNDRPTYLIHDPMMGEAAGLPPAYCLGNWEARHAMFGVRIFRKVE